MIAKNSLFGPSDPAPDTGYKDPPPRKGFFTDTSICIGCKACEVACKEWNEVPDDGFNLLGMSYDNTGSLNADTWRHVAFIEQRKPLGNQQPGLRSAAGDLGMPAMGPTNGQPAADTASATGATPDFRRLVSAGGR